MVKAPAKFVGIAYAVCVIIIFVSLPGATADPHGGHQTRHKQLYLGRPQGENVRLEQYKTRQSDQSMLTSVLSGVKSWIASGNNEESNTPSSTPDVSDYNQHDSYTPTKSNDQPSGMHTVVPTLAPSTSPATTRSSSAVEVQPPEGSDASDHRHYTHMHSVSVEHSTGDGMTTIMIVAVCGFGILVLMGIYFLCCRKKNPEWAPVSTKETPPGPTFTSQFTTSVFTGIQ